ncbi:MAG: hypothetical protein ACOH5I_01890 [Oligoflexus sp.]
MTTKPKKKRFEGLIHFKDSLRQTAVCLQASLNNKIATSVQSEFVKQLDAGPEDVHFLLFSSADQVGLVSREDEMTSHHILSRFHQKTSDELAKEIEWHLHEKTKVSVWIDPIDHLAANAFYRIISHVCYSGQTLNLKHCQNWGSLITDHSYSDLQQAKVWLAQWQSLFQLNQERLNLIRNSLDQTHAYFTDIDNLYLTSDGTCVSLIIEGELQQHNKTNLTQTVRLLRDLTFHSVTLNLGERDQLCLTSPIRLNSAQHPSPLKSFILIKGLQKHSTQHLVKKIAS